MSAFLKRAIAALSVTVGGLVASKLGGTAGDLASEAVSAAATFAASYVVAHIFHNMTPPKTSNIGDP